MKQQTFKYLVTTLLTTVAFSYSGPVFKLNKKSVPKDLVPNIERFLSNVDEKVPATVRDAIGEAVEITFTKFKENEAFSKFPTNRCDDAAGIKYGKVSFFNRDEIKISSLFINEIINNEEDTIQFNCGHRNYLRKAQATILHELAHLYDLKYVRTDEHKSKARICEREKEDRNHVSSECRAVLSQERNRKSISGLHSFFKLANWKKGFFKKKTKNLSNKRSADSYEYENLDEHNAVNFEFFLMDKDYKCKRPSYYKFYSELLNHRPFEDNNCEIYSKIVLDDLKTVRDINPDRVYRVDYLLASKGDSVISGFGHSMFRIVLCAPFRKKVDENCLKDKLYHVVLSYRANVSDIKSDMLKGVFGGYDSVLFMLSFPEVLNEYNGGELRDLISQPIYLSKEEKRDFIHKVLETYWEYEGDYKFITNNCASESNELFQAAFPSSDFAHERVILPYSLLDKFTESKFSNEEDLDDLEKAQEQGMFFPSDIDLLKHVKKSLFGMEESDYKVYRRRVGPQHHHRYKKIKREKFIKDILEEFDVDRLFEKYEELKLAGETRDVEQGLKNLSILTGAIFKIKQAYIDEEVGNFLDKNMEEETELGKRINRWNELRKSTRVKPNDHDYGIPLVVKDSDFERHNTKAHELEEMENQLLEDVKANYEDEVQDLARVLDLIRNIRNESRIMSMKIYSNQ
ncbi:DUF4105 domain-containing protein [Halobacteriovorax sp.]|uniref:DUF7844 domain-containing protein n=1 Tax=Halobacteriovorax sp. TaxID=2020862 RepID=UPI003AF214A1